MIHNTTICDANDRLLYLRGIFELNFQAGKTLKVKEFLTHERLAVPFILGCNFCDRFVEGSYPQQRLVQLEDGSLFLFFTNMAAKVETLVYARRNWSLRLR